jgi:hypothetical protein
MPVMKCSNGEYKIGNDGDCRYSTKEKAEKAQQAYYASKNESVEEGDVHEGRWPTGPDWLAEYWDFLDRIELFTPGDVEDATNHFLSKNPEARKATDEIEQAMQEKIQEFEDEDLELNEDRRRPINTENYNIFYQQMLGDLINSSPSYKDLIYKELWPLVKGGDINKPRPNIFTKRDFGSFEASMIRNFRDPSYNYFTELVKELWQAIQSNKNNNITEDSAEETKDTVSMDHSFLLRILELMREYEGMDDVLLHKVADRIIEKGDTVTMDDYDDIVQDLDPEKAGYSSKYGNDEMEEEVLKSPQDWDDGDRGPVTDDPEHQGKRELDELDMLLRWSGQKR